MDDLHLDLGLIQTISIKGDKERIILSGDVTIDFITRYLKAARPKLVSAKRMNSYLFINNHGGKLSRQGVWKNLKARSQGNWYRKKRDAAWVAPLVFDSHLRKWCGLACRSGAFRACRYFDDSNLYAYFEKTPGTSL